MLEFRCCNTADEHFAVYVMSKEFTFANIQTYFMYWVSIAWHLSSIKKHQKPKTKLTENQTNRKQILPSGGSRALLSLAYKYMIYTHLIMSLRPYSLLLLLTVTQYIFRYFAPALLVACYIAMSMLSFNVYVVFCARKQHEQKRDVRCALLLEMSTFPLHSLTHCWNLYAMSDAELLCAHIRFEISCCEHISTNSMILNSNRNWNWNKKRKTMWNMTTFVCVFVFGLSLSLCLSGC